MGLYRIERASIRRDKGFIVIEISLDGTERVLPRRFATREEAQAEIGRLIERDMENRRANHPR